MHFLSRERLCNVNIGRWEEECPIEETLLFHIWLFNLEGMEDMDYFAKCVISSKRIWDVIGGTG